MHNDLLQAIFEHVKPKIGENNFRDWFSKCSLSYDNGYKLNFPNKFVYEWVKNHYSVFIFSAAETIGIEIELQVKEEASSTSSIETANINERFTFEDFIVGKSNQMAYEAAYRVAQSDEIVFNPLFIYGNVGLGKTHLMNAIANYKKARSPKKKILYLSAEQFMQHFVRALQTKTVMTFKDEFRSADILLIDDFQFLGSREGTQEEFFHTFNTLLEQKKQLVISADQPPSSLPGVEARLSSRLGWGLVVDIHPASYELKVGILRQKAEKSNVQIDQEMLELIANTVTSSIRELEGAFLRVIKYAEWMKLPIDRSLIESVLQNMSVKKKKSCSEILAALSQKSEIDLDEIKSSTRKRHVVRARQKAVFLIRELTGESYMQIAKVLGGKDHTSIIYAETQARNLIKEDPEFARDIEAIRKIFE